MNKKARNSAIFVPPFSLMILVQSYMLFKNLVETWVWKLTVMKLLTIKVLYNLEKPCVYFKWQSCFITHYLCNADLVLIFYASRNKVVIWSLDWKEEEGGNKNTFLLENTSGGCFWANNKAFPFVESETCQKIKELLKAIQIEIQKQLP